MKECYFKQICKLAAFKYNKNNTTPQEFLTFCNEENGLKSQNTPQTMKSLLWCVLLFETIHLIAKLKNTCGWALFLVKLEINDLQVF